MTPWLDQPVMLHSSRENMCMLTEEQCTYKNYRWRFWYVADWVYALSTIYFMVAAIALFTIARFASRWAPDMLRRQPLWQKSLATARYLSYKAFHFRPLSYFSPSLGVLLLGAIGFIFFASMTLGPKPYYWPKIENGSFGDSPPIATRAGWMALALLPFVIALPMKLNLITQVTGIAHEKLQVFHRWTAWAMLVLALIHTFPFIIVNIQKGEMVEQWNTSVLYWTGVVAILAQAYLTFFSISFIRNKFYEIFKATHITAAIIFALFLFFHCDGILTSWDYFIATGVLYFLPFFLALTRTFHEHGVLTAVLTPLPGDTTLVTIPTHPTATWAPAQHMFLRFLIPSAHAITAHPFTICSTPSDGEMRFIIRARDGFTARLYAMASQRPGRQVKVLLDGPYGGIQETNMSSFDNVVLIAGGSGAGLTLPIIDEVLSTRIRTRPHDNAHTNAEKETLLSTTSQNLHIIISTRSDETAKWYRSRLDDLLRNRHHVATINVAIHVTGAAAMALPNLNSSTSSSQTKLEAEELEDSANERHTFHTGRPDVPAVIADVTSQERSVGIVACGPHGMVFDAKQAAAAAQLRILKRGGQPVYLHTEAFDW